MADISVLFTAQDSLTKEVEKMRESVRKMGRDVQDYKKIQDRAFKEKAELQFDMRKARQELKELAKLERDGAEGSKEAYIEKQRQINEMSEGVKRYNQVISQANKAERDLMKTQSRNSNNPNSRKEDGGGGVIEFGQTLVKAGLFKELGQSFGNATNAYISSAYGEKIGNRIGTVAGSMTSTAGMGAVVGGVPGAVIGAGIGAVKGAIDVATEEKKKADGYFRDEVKGIYAEVTELNNKGLKGGIELASNRETDIIAFKNILGDKDKADTFITETEEMGSKTPFTQQELLNLGKTMMTYGYKQEEILPNLNKLGDAFSALGVDGEGKQSAVTALGRMRSSGKTDLKNINVLQSKGIDAVGILAAKMETSKQKVYEMISKGVIDGADTVRVITETVGEKYKGAMEEFSKTTTGLESTLSDLRDKGDRAEGEGYNTERKKGLMAEIEYLEQLKTKDREYIGQYKASLKNKEEELMRSTIESAKNSEEYRKAVASGNGAEIGKLLADAQTKAMIEWQNSPEMQKLHEAELARVKATQGYIRNNGGFVDFGQQMAEQFNRGWSSKIKLDFGDKIDYDAHPMRKIRNRHATGGKIADDYTPIFADKNERVLTANENQEWEKNKGKSNIVNNINVNVSDSNANADDIANVVAIKVTQALENIA